MRIYSYLVIRYFIKSKYGLTQCYLDILLFLYSEKYFSKDRFDEFDELLSWDINRFDKLLRDNWIEVFRKGSKNKRGIYQLSYKTVRIISGIYDKLEGKEIPTSRSVNPMCAKNVSYTDKVYRNFIIELNKEIRESKK